ERTMPMTSVNRAIAVGLALCAAYATQAHAQSDPHAMHMGTAHDHSAVAQVTFSELETTAAQLETARRATEKYRDVQTAEADGYPAIGPDVPGMGIHYVHSGPDRRSTAGSQPQEFDVAHPDILLYEKDAASPMATHWWA